MIRESGSQIYCRVLLETNFLWKVVRPSVSNFQPKRFKSTGKRSKFRFGTRVTQCRKECCSFSSNFVCSYFISWTRTFHGHNQSLLSKRTWCFIGFRFAKSFNISESRPMVKKKFPLWKTLTLTCFVISERYNEVRANAGLDCCIILVGNKLDQRHIRAILPEEARRYAEDRNIQYVETSALDATNVEQAFRTLIVDIYRRWASRMDTMKEESNANYSSKNNQTIRAGSPSNSTSKDSNPCCANFS